MEPREICIGHSPDPDDAFMFYALTHDKIDTGDLTFTEKIEDIEGLNHRAMEGELEVTALSAHAYGYVMDKYALLPNGGSFGDRCGPIVVANRPMDVGELADVRIAVPGTMTSAYLLLKLLLMNFKFEVVPFDRIMEAVRNGDADAGLLIHEGQLTYRQMGLHKVVDLGEWWHADTGFACAAGGQRRAQGPRQATHAEGGRPPAAKHPVRPDPSRGSRRRCHAIRQGNGRGDDGPVCRHVRESVDRRNGAARTGSHRTAARPGLSCRAPAAPGSSGVRRVMGLAGPNQGCGA